MLFWGGPNPGHGKTHRQQEEGEDEDSLTYEGVERRVGAHTPHLVDGLKGQDVLLILRASQGAAGATAGAEVPRGEGH